MLNRELLCRFSFFMSGATQLMGFVSGVTGGVLFPVLGALVVLLVGLLPLLPLLLLEFVVFDGKAWKRRIG